MSQEKYYLKINGQKASVKTRRIVKKQGPVFYLIKYGYEHSSERNYDMLFKSEKTGWNGWLPLEEIKYEKISD